MSTLETEEMGVSRAPSQCTLHVSGVPLNRVERFGLVCYLGFGFHSRVMEKRIQKLIQESVSLAVYCVNSILQLLRKNSSAMLRNFQFSDPFMLRPSPVVMSFG